MMNAGNRKPLLPLLILAIILCGAMALGSTFATGVNKSGSRDDLYLANNQLDYSVTLAYNKGTGNYYESLLSSSPFADVVWCPGYTDIVYLKLTNQEKFPVTCELDIVVDESSFGDQMSYAVIYGLQPGMENHPSNWADFRSKANIVDTLIKKSPQKASTYKITKEVLVAPGDSSSRYYALAIHMDEKASNTYQGQSMKLSFNLRVNADFEHGATPSN